MIEAINLWKEYGDNVVLERLNLKVEEGEFITMVGASGCGKSTFLNLLLGTQNQTRGELLIDGKPIPQEPGPDRGIVFQQYSVFPHMTVLENVMAAKVRPNVRRAWKPPGYSKRWGWGMPCNSIRTSYPGV